MYIIIIIIIIIIVSIITVFAGVLFVHQPGANHAPTILDKINGKPKPPLPPESRIGKWRVFALRAASSLIWGGWGFAVLFYFVQDCRASVTQVNHSVHTLSTFLRIGADPSMQIF